MSGSEPEELVAKLYEDGMSDDEVREQLTDFGLSGREIHHLIKKAKKLMGGRGRVSRRAHLEVPGEGTKPEEPLIPTEPDPMIQQLMKEAKESPSAREPEPAELEEPIELPELPEEEPAEAKELEKKEEEKKPKEKKSGFLSGIFKKKKDEDKKEEKKEEKPSEPGEKKPKEKKGRPEHHDAAYMATMKRLSMIKEAISSPAAPSGESRWAPKGAPEETPEERPEKASEGASQKDEMGQEIDKIMGKPAEAQTKALTTEEEEKMDEETAKRLTDGMGKLETEMGEIKQLLDTLRELNIKMIELMEKN